MDDDDRVVVVEEEEEEEELIFEAEDEGMEEVSESHFILIHSFLCISAFRFEYNGLLNHLISSKNESCSNVLTKKDIIYKC